MMQAHERFPMSLKSHRTVILACLKLSYPLASHLTTQAASMFDIDGDHDSSNAQQRGIL